MAEPPEIKKAQERIVRAFEVRPGAAKFKGRTTVRVTSGASCEIKDGEWTLTGDQSKAFGGENLGPNPGVFGRASLGSCLAQGYAYWFARLEVPFEEIEVVIDGEGDNRASLGMEVEFPPGYQRLRAAIRVESSAALEDIRKAMAQADRCSPWLYNFANAIEVDLDVTIEGT
jgi:uncharacterized OsmC-like protein